MVRDTLIFVPTYNEKENVRAMSEQLLALPVDADVLFCDDASPDGTGDVLDEIAGANPRMAVMHRSGKLGIGSAHLDGIAYACPLIDGSWSESCAVDLNSLATMAGHSLRGRSVPLALALQYVRVGRVPLPRLPCLPL